MESRIRKRARTSYEAQTVEALSLQAVQDIANHPNWFIDPHVCSFKYDAELRTTQLSESLLLKALGILHYQYLANHPDINQELLHSVISLGCKKLINRWSYADYVEFVQQHPTMVRFRHLLSHSSNLPEKMMWLKLQKQFTSAIVIDAQKLLVLFLKQENERLLTQKVINALHLFAFVML